MMPINPLDLPGSQFLEWARDRARHTGISMIAREESARSRGMQVVPENLDTAHALLALDAMAGAMIAIGKNDVIVRLVAAARNAIKVEIERHGRDAA